MWKFEWKKMMAGVFGLFFLMCALAAGAEEGGPAATQAGQSGQVEERPTVNLSVALMSQYIWRGQELSHDSMVIEPSMTIGYKGFTYNMWGNMDTDRHADSSKLNGQRPTRPFRMAPRLVRSS
ncbi:MAG: hypothetical protein ACP5SG_00510 [Dissulfurimicrobium sp.]|uniref:hypothetical protein n=1 Tax=Dissulfurimicrobium sp. TaxID=2022436 RepID=UPI003D1208B5